MSLNKSDTYIEPVFLTQGQIQTTTTPTTARPETRTTRNTTAVVHREDLATPSGRDWFPLPLEQMAEDPSESRPPSAASGV